MRALIAAAVGVLIFATTAVSEDLAGIGLDIVQRKNPSEPLGTTTVHPGSPAEKAGIKPGGFLVSVDSTNVVSMPLKEAVNMIRGKVGTSVTIQLADAGMKHTNTFTVKRSRMVILDNKMTFSDR